MQAGSPLSLEDQAEAEAIWIDMAEYVSRGCQKLADKTGLNIHKQWTNRPLEWFGYIDVLVTSTDWANFDYLRHHPAAQDEIDILCAKMMQARANARPQFLQNGDWHLPYVRKNDRDFASLWAKNFGNDLNEIFLACDLPDLSQKEALLLVSSAARCCRVSYSKMDGTPSTFSDDIKRFRKLVPNDDPLHASPLEHQATPLDGYDESRQGNFKGFAQFRKFIHDEAILDDA